MRNFTAPFSNVKYLSNWFTTTLQFIILTIETLIDRHLHTKCKNCLMCGKILKTFKVTKILVCSCQKKVLCNKYHLAENFWIQSKTLLVCHFHFDIYESNSNIFLNICSFHFHRESRFAAPEWLIMHSEK